MTANDKADALERERYGPELGKGKASDVTRRLELAARVSEKEWQSTVIDAAKLLGWSVHHPYDSRKSSAGYPDLTLWHVSRRRFMLRELKTERGRVSSSQTIVIGQLRAAGVDVGIWRPSDWSRVLAELGGAPRLIGGES